jgi:hypothetical protein
MSVTGTIGAIGAIGGGIASAVGSSKAAGAQEAAANNAANLERQNAVDALNFQKQVYSNQQQNIAPWLASGKGALSNLDYLMGITPQSATAPTQATGNPNVRPEPNVDFPSDPNTFGGRGINPVTGRPIPIPFGAESTMLQQNPFSPSTIRAGAAGMLQLGPNGQPIFTTPDVNQGGVTNATTNQGGIGQVPRNDGGDPSAGMPGGFGSLAQGFNEKFAAPTDVTEQNDPGYQFRLTQGDKAIQNSAAARGGLLSGGTAKALSDYNQSSASGEYGNVYNRALTEYQQRYNIFNNNQSTLFNRLADLSGFGQTAAGQLNSAGTSAADNTSRTLLTSGQQIGQDINNAGAARGSGYVGVGNAVSGGLNNLASIYALLHSQAGGGAADPNAGMGVF